MVLALLINKNTIMWIWVLSNKIMPSASAEVTRKGVIGKEVKFWYQKNAFNIL